MALSAVAFGELIMTPAKRARPWSPGKFFRELGKARKIGLKKLPGEELLNLAVQGYGVYKRTIVGISDVVVECYRRIEALDLPEVNNSKTELCRRLGCTLTHAGRIVREVREPQNKPHIQPTERELTEAAVDLPTPEDLAVEISGIAFKKLTVFEAYPSQYEETCEKLISIIQEAVATRKQGRKEYRSAAD